MRLNNFLRRQLKRLAIKEINEELSKTKFYKEILEHKEFIGKELYKYLKENISEDKIKKYFEILDFAKINGNDIIQSESYNLTKLYDYTSNKYYINQFVDSKLLIIQFPKSIYVPNVSFKLTNNIDKYVKIHSMMTNDVYCFIQHELCPYELLIHKKNTLNSLAKIWPGAEKLKIDNIHDHTKGCRVMTEADAIKKIQKKTI